MTWHAHIAVKGNGHFNDAHWDEVKSWPEVEKVWSTMGNWDWWVKLDSSVQAPTQIEALVADLRKKAWVSDTDTAWWKEV